MDNGGIPPEIDTSRPRRSVYLETDMREPGKRGGVDVAGRDHDVSAGLVFRGLTLVPPGVVVVSEWRPGPHAFQPPRADVSNNGAVAGKP